MQSMSIQSQRYHSQLPVMNTYLLLRQQPQPQPQLLEKLPPLQLQPLFQLPVKPPRPLLPPRNPTQIMIQTATILILRSWFLSPSSLKLRRKNSPPPRPPLHNPLLRNPLPRDLPLRNQLPHDLPLRNPPLHNLLQNHPLPHPYLLQQSTNIMITMKCYSGISVNPFLVNLGKTTPF